MTEKCISNFVTKAHETVLDSKDTPTFICRLFTKKPLFFLKCILCSSLLVLNTILFTYVVHF